jgi:quercetin dioxygenase-like cupin family protein
MRIFRGVLGKVPSGPKSRVRNFIANKELGTQSDIHENVVSPGVTVPWHYHETEEVIIVLEGSGECRTEANIESYSGGDVVILPPRVKHSLRNPGSVPIRQICVFPGDPATTFLEPIILVKPSMSSTRAVGLNQVVSSRPLSVCPAPCRK